MRLAKVVLGLVLLGTSSVATPLSEESELESRQDSTSVTTDATTWCNTPDFTDATNAWQIWEEWGIGYWLTDYLQGLSPTDDGWVNTLFKTTNPTNGANTMGNCGTIGASCTAPSNCNGMVTGGNAQAYWALQAVAGFQDHLNAAHEALQDDTIEKSLNIQQLVTDFSADQSYQPLGATTLATILGAAFFLLGGLAGAASLIGGEIVAGTEAAVEAAEVASAAAEAGEGATAEEATAAEQAAAAARGSGAADADELTAAAEAKQAAAAAAKLRAEGTAQALKNLQASAAKFGPIIKGTVKGSNYLGAGSCGYFLKVRCLFVMTNNDAVD